MENESDHDLTLSIAGGGEIKMTRDNSQLFTFAGKLATRNHIFIRTGEGETPGSMRGSFIFAHAPHYVAIANYMIEHEYPMTLNQRGINAADEDAFLLSLDTMSGSFDDFPPEDWK